jgi:hypothetical protein
MVELGYGLSIEVLPKFCTSTKTSNGSAGSHRSRGRERDASGTVADNPAPQRLTRRSTWQNLLTENGSRS